LVFCYALAIESTCKPFTAALVNAGATASVSLERPWHPLSRSFSNIIMGMSLYRFKENHHLYIAWLLFLAIDLIIVRDISRLKELLHGERFLVNYAVTSLALLPLLYIVGRFLQQSRPRKVIAFFILYIPLIMQSTYFEIYKSFVPRSGVRFFVENPLLTLQLWIENANYFKLAVISCLVLVGLALLAKHPYRRSRWPLAGSIFFLIGVYTLSLFSWYSIAKFQNSIVAYSTILLESMKVQNVVQPVIDRPKIPPPAGSQIRPNIVLVIGEAMAASHMSLYGYHRQTTPNLEKFAKNKTLLAFKNAISIGTKTLTSVPYMLVGLQGIDPNGIIYSYPTIFNYAKAVGYNTAFISAQDIRWKNLDKFIIDRDVDYHRSGVDFNPSANVTKGADDLLVLEKGIKPYLKAVKNPFLLVVQMDGNHYPYTTHSPAEYKKFLPEQDKNDINAYDNTLVYSDIFLNNLFEAIRQKDKNAWIFFTPDHGQTFGGDDGFFNESYTKNVIYNALLVSPPNTDFAKIKKNENRPVSQADIAATIIDLMQMRPVKPIDGQSLLQPIGPRRLRICSKYMPTGNNRPSAVLVFEDLSYYHINFDKKRVTLKDGRTILPFSQLEMPLQALFTRRLSKNNAE
jgi:glucan phosphoethanolaminetransferase (alkaline phosphatase superfamily)